MNPIVKGSIRSKTNWLGLAVVILGYIQLPENMKVLAEYIPAALVPLANMLVGVCVIAARFVTSESLAEKGQ